MGWVVVEDGSHEMEGYKGSYCDTAGTINCTSGSPFRGALWLWFSAGGTLCSLRHCDAAPLTPARPPVAVLLQGTTRWLSCRRTWCSSRRRSRPSLCASPHRSCPRCRRLNFPPALTAAAAFAGVRASSTRERTQRYGTGSNGRCGRGAPQQAVPLAPLPALALSLGVAPPTVSTAAALALTWSAAAAAACSEHWEIPMIAVGLYIMMLALLIPYMRGRCVSPSLLHRQPTRRPAASADMRPCANSPPSQHL